jgi:uncharacterized protein
MVSVLKSIIFLYQKWAPSRIRESCRYEPSCSNYTLLALDKYGSIRGVYKGFDRICRCKYPQGGIDYP